MENTKTAIYAGGCFWGMQHLMKTINGVVDVVAGYIGGNKENPSYEEVKSQMTNHAEAVMVSYDPQKTDFETITKFFFEIHDPTQEDGQGPDIGNQYRSEIFYNNSEEKEIAQRLINILKAKGFNVVTKLTPVSTFWKAENYHQNYYQNNGSEPYCHIRVKRF